MKYRGSEAGVGGLFQGTTKLFSWQDREHLRKFLNKCIDSRHSNQEAWLEDETKGLSPSLLPRYNS